MSRCRGRTGGLSAEWSDWGTAAGGHTLLYHPTQTKRKKTFRIRLSVWTMKWIFWV